MCSALLTDATKKMNELQTIRSQKWHNRLAPPTKLLLVKDDSHLLVGVLPNIHLIPDITG